MSGAPLREDIQALRGYAVALVILYHAGLGLAPAGFLGVDIFFVVSGYLIGGGVLRQLAAGEFRFAGFYLRRIRRLVPAAYAVLLLTVIASAFLLTFNAHVRFAAQVLGSLGYATNIVLWQQINYFNNAAASEPLLHIWSLAIEEQFYLLLPLALWLVPRRWRALAVGAATLISLAAWLLLYPRSPGLAFYLLPTRAWELGLGVGTAMLAIAGWGQGMARRLAMPALALVLAAALVRLPVPQHGLPLAACIGTAILLRAELALPRALWPLARIGDASYSLYLVHWPLFAFAHVLWLGAAPPLWVSLLLITVTGLLGTLLYRWVEQPGRFSPQPPRRVLLAYAAATLALAALILGTSALVRKRGAPVDLAGVTGLPLSTCDADAERFDGACRTSNSPEILVWGDSFSQQLIPALQASGAGSIVQASKGQCAPLLGLAPLDRDAPLPFARGCLAFNDSVIVYLRSAPSVEVVVLSGFYDRYAQAGTIGLRPGGQSSAASLAELISAQQRTTTALRALGKRVVITSGPPQARFDPGQCWARRLTGLPSITPASDCAITPQGAALSAGWNDRLLRAFAAEAATPVIRLDRLLCPNPARCETARGGVVLYRDSNHLGLAGSRYTGKTLGLSDRVAAEAR